MDVLYLLLYMYFLVTFQLVKSTTLMYCTSTLQAKDESTTT